LAGYQGNWPDVGVSDTEVTGERDWLAAATRARLQKQTSGYDCRQQRPSSRGVIEAKPLARLISVAISCVIQA